MPGSSSEPDLTHAKLAPNVKVGATRAHSPEDVEQRPSLTDLVSVMRGVSTRQAQTGAEDFRPAHS